MSIRPYPNREGRAGVRTSIMSTDNSNFDNGSQFESVHVGGLNRSADDSVEQDSQHGSPVSRATSAGDGSLPFTAMSQDGFKVTNHADLRPDTIVEINGYTMEFQSALAAGLINPNGSLANPNAQPEQRGN